MSIFVKELEDGRIIEAPRNYKNISNFNKFPSIMKKHGFVEKIKAYKKSDGTLKYVDPENWSQHEAFYTENTYPGADYVWDDATENWTIKLEVAKEQKLDEIRDATNSYMKQLKTGFSDAEMETWGRQENGVKLLSENIDSQEYDALWVKSLAQTRGISLEEQMQRISQASNMMNEYAYRLVGYQQSLEDKINAATTVEEVQQIKFSIEQ
jgi:hypothetical protein